MRTLSPIAMVSYDRRANRTRSFDGAYALYDRYLTNAALMRLGDA
jgi:hypothetical protein